MFEMGDIENLKAYDLKQFIRKRLNEKLLNSVTQTAGNTLNMTKLERAIWTGSTILPGGTLILISFLLGRLITRKLMKVKTLKIFGK